VERVRISGKNLNITFFFNRTSGPIFMLFLSDFHIFCRQNRSSETSTNQSDVIIRSDDRFLNLVVDCDSIVSKIYMLNFVLWLFFIFFNRPWCSHACLLFVIVRKLSGLIRHWKEQSEFRMVLHYNMKTIMRSGYEFPDVDCFL
jgi:hypothetical protein